jgi:hypothetical protein
MADTSGHDGPTHHTTDPGGFESPASWLPARRLETACYLRKRQDLGERSEETKRWGLRVVRADAYPTRGRGPEVAWRDLLARPHYSPLNH